MTKMSEDEVISLNYSISLRMLREVNVGVSAFFVQVYKSSFLLKEFTECASVMSFGKLFQGVAIMLRRKCFLGSLPDVFALERAEMDVYGLYCFSPVLVFCFRHAS